MKIDLKEAPEVLQVSVKEILGLSSSHRLLFVSKSIAVPFIDESLKTEWKAYIDCGGFFMVSYVVDCRSASWKRGENVETYTVWSSDILALVEQSETIRNLVGAKLRETEQS
ncbi:hypothetical protein CEB3_c17950 [Peptococcaceae bacterium CEB3]|nr:hypothetical protein CEB3_c17950 [Peptococcaceae bacterium CEB3]